MILVTGATGMIGRAVVLRLLQDGIAVRAHGRSSTDLDAIFSSAPVSKNALLEHAEADFANMDAAAADRLCSGCTGVIHSAGLVHLPESSKSLYDLYNVKASQMLAESAKKAGVKHFIFLSSTSVYGNKATNMIKESDNTDTDTPYAASKKATEDYLRENPPAPSTVALRPSLVFGEGDRGNMLPLIRQVLGGKYFIIGDGDANKSLIYAADLALALSAVLRSSNEGFALYNIANPQPVTVRKLSEAILSAANKDRSLISVPSWVISLAASAANVLLKSRSPLSPDRLAKLTRNNSISVESFQSKYNFVPRTDLETALRAEIQWAKDTNKL